MGEIALLNHPFLDFCAKNNWFHMPHARWNSNENLHPGWLKTLQPGYWYRGVQAFDICSIAVKSGGTLWVNLEHWISNLLNVTILLMRFYIFNRIFFFLEKLNTHSFNNQGFNPLVLSCVFWIIESRILWFWKSKTNRWLDWPRCKGSRK